MARNAKQKEPIGRPRQIYTGEQLRFCTIEKDKIWHMLIPQLAMKQTLQCVLLGVADQSGPIPKYEEAYDPKSRLHILKGTYPRTRLIHQLDLMHAALEKHGVEVLRPQL